MVNKEKTLRFLKGVVCGILIAGIVIYAVSCFKSEMPDYDNLNVEGKAALIATMLENNYIEDFEENELADKMYAGMYPPVISAMTPGMLENVRAPQA